VFERFWTMKKSHRGSGVRGEEGELQGKSSRITHGHCRLNFEFLIIVKYQKGVLNCLLLCSEEKKVEKYCKMNGEACVFLYILFFFCTVFFSVNFLLLAITFGLHAV